MSESSRAVRIAAMTAVPAMALMAVLTVGPAFGSGQAAGPATAEIPGDATASRADAAPAAPSAQPGTSPQLVEDVVGVVGKEPILLSEARTHLAAAIEAFEVDASDAAALGELRKQVLEQLIDQEMLYQEARTQGIAIDEAEVGKAVEEMIARSRQQLGSEQQFQAQLQREGLSLEDLRQRLARQARHELAISQLVRRRFPDEPAVSDEDIRRFYEAHRAEIPPRDAAVHLQHILIRVQPDSVLQQAVLARAQATAQQIRSGELTFEDAARRYSDDPNGREGGDLRRVKRGDFADRLGPAFEEALFGLAVGDIGGPLPSPLGYHLLRVTERDPGGEWVHAYHVLFGVPLVRADETRAEERAARIFGELRAGAAFEQAAQTHSDDRMTRERGGDLGWIPQAALEGDLAQVVDTLQVGALSRPIPSEGAFHIFRLLGREAERAYTLDEITADLADYVRAEKRQEDYAAWVLEIKRNYYIERRSWE